MPYCTQAILEEHYGTNFLIQLTDRGEEATGMINSATVERAIAAADGMINGHLAGRYVLPLSAVPDPIPTIAERLAIYELHVYEPSDKIVRDYKDALATLDKISKGTIQLAAAGIATPTTGGGSARVTDRTRDFTAESMKGLI